MSKLRCCYKLNSCVVVKNIRNDIYRSIIRLSLSFYSEKKRGDIVARISSDVQELDHSFLSIS